MSKPFNVIETGLCQDANFLLFGDGSALDTDTTAYTLADKARNANGRMDDFVSLVLESDGRWQWDDTEQTDLPIGTSTLVDGQQDYALTGQTYLKITRVEVLDQNGIYQLVLPMDQTDITYQALTEYRKTAGLPRVYDKIGDSIFFYPKVGSSFVTLSAGLKVYFQRGAVQFVSGDTTKVGGISPLFHRYISIGMALDFALANGLNTKVNMLQGMLEKLEQKAVTFYSSRSRDEQVRLNMRREDYGQQSGMDVGMSRSRSDLIAF